MTEPQQLTIHLSGDAVVAPALRIIQQTVETVSFCLIAVDSGDMSKPAEFERARMQMRFSGDMSPDERRALYTNWLLSNGFQELARGIRATLDEALLYTEIFHLIESGKRTWGEFPEKVQEIRRRGTRAMFPDLMAAVNKGLSAPLHFEKEFLSLQKVRNCLEHRDGLVSDIDVDKETKTLKLSLPRFKMFYEKNDEEIELQVGTCIEANTMICVKNIVQEREFKLGERVTFKPEEFHDIGWGCWAFTSDLGSKLPKKGTV